VHKYRQVSDEEDTAKVDNDIEKDSIAMKGPANETLSARYVRIAGVVALYWFVSITLVFVNKKLLSGSSTFSAPLFVTWFQCVVTVALLYLLQALFTIFPSSRISGFPDRLEVKLPTVKQVLPLSVVFVLMITTNNLCLKNVGVSFYYVGRSLTTVFNVLLTYLILGNKTSLRALSCCGVIVFGFWLGVDQELLFSGDPTSNSDAGSGSSLSMWGIFFGITSSLFVAANAIYTKKVLPVVEENIWQLSLYNNVNASFLFLPLILMAGETQNVISSEEIFSGWFWFTMFAGGVFGFAIGYVTGLQIQVTSPLTHSVSGTAKAAAQTVLATQLASESHSMMWWLSNALVLIGSMGYTRSKQLEMEKSRSEGGK